VCDCDRFAFNLSVYFIFQALHRINPIIFGKNNNTMIKFLSGLAVVLSLLAGAISVFSIYKISGVEQRLEVLAKSVADEQQATASLAPGEIPQAAVPQAEIEAASPLPSSNVTGVLPGQFVQSALNNEAQVELLKVKRIQNPETGALDVVNVQFRARALVDAHPSRISASITPLQTTARNPDTSEVYKMLSTSRATGNMPLREVRKGASVDAYVWLKIPEGVNTVDIYIPKTQAFKNVPIEN
jgi:hypothetical protein